jgi:hypothetical protein
MVEFRWMLEGLQVFRFAQELRTPMPVSAKLLQKVWESMQRQANRAGWRGLRRALRRSLFKWR